MEDGVLPPEIISPRPILSRIIPLPKYSTMKSAAAAILGLASCAAARTFTVYNSALIPSRVQSTLRPLISLPNHFRLPVHYLARDRMQICSPAR